ncbi:MAG: hypothetical protein GWO08_10945 [Gammaproteobacteria bacterium]|nr:hypothetical protein [Gammaproteobacteria bacterium]
MPEGRPYYLLARQAFGGPAGSGELYGKLLAPDGAPQAITVSDQQKEVVIHVAPEVIE